MNQLQILETELRLIDNRIIAALRLERVYMVKRLLARRRDLPSLIQQEKMRVPTSYRLSK
jgi:hypothetical protein